MSPEQPAQAVETAERDPIVDALTTAGEIIKELTVVTASAATPWLFSHDIPLPKGLLVIAYTSPAAGQEIDRPSEYIVRQLSNSFIPGSKVREVVAEYRWDALRPEDKSHQFVTKSDPAGRSKKLEKRIGFDDKDAKSIKKLVAKAKKALA